jgi:hypothetical protein
MSMNLFTASERQLQLLSAYENGGVTLWRYTRTDKQTSVEGIGWEAIWSVKLHVESGLHFWFRFVKLLIHMYGSHGYGRF